MTNTENSFPQFVVTFVEYLHDYNPAYEPEPVSYRLPNSIFGDRERVTTCEEALEVVFRECNHVDGSEIISQPEFRASLPYRNLRSMSTGDIVTFRAIGGWRRTFVCEGVGWKEISNDDALWLVKNIKPRDFCGTFAKTVEKNS